MGAIDYNYEHFDQYVQTGAEVGEFGSFFARLHAGEAAPDGSVTRLEDLASVSLSDLWNSRPLVMEFGSFT